MIGEFRFWEAAAKMDAILAGADPALVKQTEARIN